MANPVNLNKPFTPSTGQNLGAVDSGVYITEIPGLGKIETYGAPLRFRSVQVPKDNSIITEKRDRFEKRNAFLNQIAEAGEFQYAVAVAPSVGGKRLAQCNFCGAHHNWCVFYKDAKGNYLGWSGTDCFAEVVKNLRLPAFEAMIEAVKSERSRSEKFRRTMEKINDFKADFPGLYEHRKELLNWQLNPYSRLWQETMARLNDAKGVNEEWLAACERGAFDRSWRSWDRNYGINRVHSDQQARRIPKFLAWASNKAKEGVPFGEILSQLQAKHRQETEVKAAAPAPAAAPAAPLPVHVHTWASQLPPAPKVNDDEPKKASEELVGKAKTLLDTGRFGWAKLLPLILAGGTLTKRQVQVVEGWYENESVAGRV